MIHHEIQSKNLSEKFSHFRDKERGRGRKAARFEYFESLEKSKHFREYEFVKIDFQNLTIYDKR